MTSVFRHIVPLSARGLLALYALALLFTHDGWAQDHRAGVRQPVRFTENRGQWDARARFRARLDGAVVWVTDSALVYDHRTQAHGHVVAMEFGGTSAPVVHGRNRHQAPTSFLWSTHAVRNVPSYDSLYITGLYRGIDLVLRTDGAALRYDFVVAPHASPEQIAVRFCGVEAAAVRVDTAGELSLDLATGTVQHGRLFAYQTIGDSTVAVACRFIRRSDGMLGFELGAYDRTRALIIDPLVFSTVFGGTDDDVPLGLAADAAGNIYTTGYTFSTDFPTRTGAYSATKSDSSDVFITKFSPDGTAILYSTYLGGTREDRGTALAVDSAGEVVLAGTTRSFDFPTTPTALDPTYNGSYDVFFARLSSRGDSLLYSSYLGHNGDDIPHALALHGDMLYLTGETTSGKFPVTGNIVQPTRASATDVFISVVDTRGTQLRYSTFFGGSSGDVPRCLAVSSTGTITVGGRTASNDLPVSATAVKDKFSAMDDGFDGFLIQLNPYLSELLYCSYFGGSGNEERIEAVEYTANGDLLVAGWTNSMDFPVTPDAFDTAATDERYENGFLAVVSAEQGILHATYFGGNDRASTRITDIATDVRGNIFCTGSTFSSSLPVTPDAFDGSYAIPSNGDAFFACVTGTLDSVLYCTYIGGSQRDEGVQVVTGRYNSAVLTGTTRSPDFPVHQGTGFTGQADGFLLSFSLGALLGSPNGGDTVCAGSFFSIEWQASRLVDSVMIEVERVGAGRSVIVPAFPAVAGVWSWPVPPAMPGGFYRLRLIDAGTGLLLDESDTLFELHSRPVFTAHPADVQKCPGSNVTLECNATAFPLPSYQWQRMVNNRWEDIAGEYSRFLTINGLDPAVHNGLYRARATTACGHTAYSNPAHVTSYALPAVVLHPLPIMACPGETVTFTTRSSDPQASIHWEFRTSAGDVWAILQGETAEELVVHNVAEHQHGWEYRAVFHNICDSRTTPARLSVRPRPTITAHPESDTVCPGATAVFTVEVPTPGISIRWQYSTDLRTWTDIPGAVSRTYTRSPVRTEDNGLYFRAVVRNTCSEIAVLSQAAQLRVNTQPDLVLSAGTLEFGTLGFCADDSVASVQIVNNGSDTVVFGTPVLASDHFSISHFPARLAPGEEHLITIRFAPAAVPVDATADMLLPIGLCGYAVVLALHGRKVEAPVVSTMRFVDFGRFPTCDPAPVDTTLTIVNTGPVMITLLNGVVAPPFALSSPRAFPIVVPSGDSVSFRLRYSPSASVGTDRALVHFPFATASSCSDTLTVEARGTRAEPGLAVAATIQFPTLPSCSTEVDTVVRIVNTGEVPIHLGPDALIVGTAFRIDYPAAGAVLGSGEHIDIPIVFSPDADGDYDGYLSFTHSPCGSTHTIHFTGRMTTPALSPNTDELVFSSGVRSRSVVLTNTGELPLTLAAVQIDRQVYSVQLPRNLPYTLAPDESLVATVTFDEPGTPVHAVLTARTDAPCALAATVRLRVDDTAPASARIAVPALSHYLGEEFALPILIDTADIAALYAAGVASFRAVLAFNATMLTPVDPSERGDLRDGLHFMTVEGALAARNRDTLAAVLMLAALGNSSFTPVEVRSFNWLDGPGTPVPFPTEARPGSLFIANVKKGQHVHPSGAPFAIGITPLPAEEHIDLRIAHLPTVAGAVLEVFDATGMRVADWTPLLSGLAGSPHSGYGGTVQPEIGTLAAGVYYCRLSLWNFSIVCPFVVR